ncbi:MAG: DsbA family protein [Thermonemataceae bacterium]
MELTIRQIRGNPPGRIRIIQFIDFQEDKCQEYYYGIEHYLMHYPQCVHVVKHLPLQQPYDISLEAARAVEWAATKNMFWETVEALLLQDKPLCSARILESLDKLHLDPGDFTAQQSDLITKNIAQDKLEGSFFDVVSHRPLLIQTKNSAAQWSQPECINAVEQIAAFVG